MGRVLIVKGGPHLAPRIQLARADAPVAVRLREVERAPGVVGDEQKWPMGRTGPLGRAPVLVDVAAQVGLRQAGADPWPNRRAAAAESDAGAELCTESG